MAVRSAFRGLRSRPFGLPGLLDANGRPEEPAETESRVVHLGAVAMKDVQSRFYADWNSDQMKRREAAQHRAYRKAGIPFSKAKRGKKAAFPEAKE